ncbi:thiamine pyrophosphokinase [Capsulimonas corticalis]|uniref:Thiamine diphosphokinase n=1 Tax=Capsulimonas corticalis TaxID=2219043 RepID=A0A402CTS5_9BACT|nr:thiamine diphosphokinase [Capsulimonas corticalis]BDI30630.1 thiamine pyrophosphokinase [Capsulimonas corticalis]
MTNERATILANGPFVDDGRLRARIAEGGGPLIGVDGGAWRLYELGFTPRWVTGDYDSVTPAQRETLEAAGARFVETPDQYRVDLDKALAFAIDEAGARDIAVFGAGGGRLDHTVAALAAAVAHGQRASIQLIDAHGAARPVYGELTLTGSDLIGRVVSLIALGTVEDVWFDGVRWPLTGQSVGPYGRDATSNEIVSDTICVRAGAGDLLIYLHHGAPERSA